MSNPERSHDSRIYGYGALVTEGLRPAEQAERVGIGYLDRAETIQAPLARGGVRIVHA